MTTESAQHVPVLRFYREFPDEWDSLPQATRAALSDFLGQLQQNPMSPELIGNTERHGEYFAHTLPDGHSVIWKLEMPSAPLSSILTLPKRIWILAIVPSATAKKKEKGA
jgi:hypothetical protein